MWARVTTWSSNHEPCTERLRGCSCLGAGIELFLVTEEGSGTLVVRCSSCRLTLQVNVAKSSVIRIGEDLE